MFVEDMEKMAKECVLQSESGAEDVIGTSLFVLLNDSGPPYPAMAIPLSMAGTSEERKSLITNLAHSLAKEKDVNVKVFVLVAEAFASIGVDATKGLISPSEDPNSIEVVCVSAQDCHGNYRLKTFKVKRGEKNSLIELDSKKLGQDWKFMQINKDILDSGKERAGGDGSLVWTETETRVQDELIATAWREYSIARMLVNAGLS